jgi:large subunit ribosomal protein L1
MLPYLFLTVFLLRYTSFCQVLKGEIKFDKVICIPDLLRPVTTALARFLGEKGLMPTVKRGTVTEDVEEAITSCRGMTEFVADKHNKMEIGK